MPSLCFSFITATHFILESASLPCHVFQLVQNAAVRLLTGARMRDNITPILALLHRLPVYFQVHFQLLLFVFKSLTGLAPPYVSELLHLYTPALSLRSADELLLAVLRSKQNLRAPKLWNNLRTISTC